MADQSSPKKSRFPLIAALTLGVAAASVAVYWSSYGRYFQSTDNAYLQGEITNISPKVSGYIQQTFVSDNDQVQAGQLLAILDDRDYQAAFEKASANLAVAEAAITSLQAQSILQKTVIRQSASQVASAQADLERAAQQDQRARSLLAKSYSSQDEVDDARSHLKVSQANMDAAHASLQAAKDQLLVLNSQKVQAEAAVREAKAQVKQAELDLSYTRITAPVDGIVGKRSLRIGLYVQPGMPLLSLVPTKTVWIEANFKETQLADIQQGQPVDIALDAYPDQTITGMVDSFSPATGAKFALLPPENATGNFTKIVQRVPVKIVIPHPEQFKGQLLPGLSVVATIDTHPASDKATETLAKAEVSHE
ncbi:HlyD family secretion protein [Photobacterium sp. 1_MG-2023]|uniref:HlyD family secretion protein n=1 Tax=Photobacterium sp. 1_MG-2023 TaxID=3062646 RepID=UPI0026E37450|nr:HlyD family secretion protein [Photobacterium sp. 1_MG-2023]MDO6707251.1 HlyD family secretion protein [Photobacterium sp. 1_MG-2023]